MKSKYISSDRRPAASAAGRNAGILFLLAAFILICGGIHAKGIPISTDHMQGHKPLLPYITWLPDKEGVLDIGDVSTGEMASSFSPLNNRFPLSQQGPLWVRLLLMKPYSAMRGGASDNKLLLHLGDLLGGKVEVFYPKMDRLAHAPGGWVSIGVTPGAAVALPEPGLNAMPVFIKFEQTPGLWFAPYLSMQSKSEDPFVPTTLLLHGLLAVGILVCLLRLCRERTQWTFWSALFLICVLIVALFPLSDRLAGLDIRQIIPILAPGVALMLLPHLGRHLLRTKGHAQVQDGILRIYPVLGAALCLVPLLPGLGWAVKFFPLWPLLLIPLLPVCFGALSGKRPGALAFTGICVLPIIGACFTFYSIGLEEVHSLEVSAGLWGFALGGIGLALARSPRVHGEAAETGEEDTAASESDLALSVDSEAVSSLGGGKDEPGCESDKDFPLGRLELPPPGKDGVKGLELADFKFEFDETQAGLNDDVSDGGGAQPADSGEADGAVHLTADGGKEVLEDAGAVEETIRLATAMSGDVEGAEGQIIQGVLADAVEERPGNDSAEQSGGRVDNFEGAAVNEDLDAALCVPGGTGNSSALEAIEQDGQVAIVNTSVADSAEKPASFEHFTEIANPVPEMMEFQAVSNVEANGERGPRLISLGADESDALDAAGLDDYIHTRQRSVHMGENLYVFNLHELVREVHEVARPLASGKNLVVSWFVAPSLPAIMEGDASRLRQTLSLLLQSAVQSTESGGVVQLTIRKNPSGSQPMDLLIAITDSGSVTRSHAGFFHAWDLAARTGGAFSLEYSPSGGTMVSLTTCFQQPSEEGLRLRQEMLKLSEASAELKEFAELSQMEPLVGQSVLIEHARADELAEIVAHDADCPDSCLNVDREQPAVDYSEGDAPKVIVAEMTTSQRRLLDNYMSGIPHSRVEARSVEEVLRFYVERPAVLVIFDGDMPEADIVQAMRGIRRWEAEQGMHATALLVLTNHEAQSERMSAAGCDHALLKPFTKHRLAMVVANLAPALASLDAGAEPEEDGARPVDGEYLSLYRKNYAEPVRPANGLSVVCAPEQASCEVLAGQDPEVASAVSSVVEEQYLAQSCLQATEAAPVEDGRHQAQGSESRNASFFEARPVSEPVANFEGNSPAPETWWEHSMPRQDNEDACSEPQPAQDRVVRAAVDSDSSTWQPVGESSAASFPKEVADAPAIRVKATPGQPTVSVRYVRASAKKSEKLADAPADGHSPCPESAWQPDMTERPGVSGPADNLVHAEAGEPRDISLMDMIIEEDVKDVGKTLAQSEKPVVDLYPLPGLDESIPVGAMPLLPGLIQSLGEALSDAKEGCRRGNTIIVQEAVGRLAGKAEVNALETLKRIAQCVERAASADDLEAVADLMAPLEEATLRYMDSLRACYDGFVNMQR